MVCLSKELVFVLAFALALRHHRLPRFWLATGPRASGCRNRAAFTWWEPSYRPLASKAASARNFRGLALKYSDQLAALRSG